MKILRKRSMTVNQWLTNAQTKDVNTGVNVKEIWMDALDIVLIETEVNEPIRLQKTTYEVLKKVVPSFLLRTQLQ